MLLCITAIAEGIAVSEVAKIVSSNSIPNLQKGHWACFLLFQSQPHLLHYMFFLLLYALPIGFEPTCNPINLPTGS